MNELIKIQERNGQRVVNARDLFNYIESKQEFANWIRTRIDKYGFTDGVDFSSFDVKIKRGTTGGTTRKEYALTIDMAKELAMIENNDKGRAVRQYFIAVENAARQQVPAVPQNFAEALELAARQQRAIDGQTKEIARLRPKAEFAEIAVECAELTEMSMACKVLDLPYGRNIFYDLLRKTGVFFKNRNEPIQDYVDRGYFKVKQKLIKRKNHPNIVVNVPFLAEKGLIRMSAWLRERNFYDKSYVMKYLER